MNFENNPQRFCGDCGAPLAVRCPACGADSPPDKKFCGDCGAGLTKPEAATAPPARPAGAEQRQLTVMFVDLVGSTALSGKLDPEDMGRVIRAYQDCCAKVIERWDGHVAKYMGDGVVVYFGWPRAHEDDAERAVRAGLDVTDAVGRLTGGGAPLSARSASRPAW